MLKRQAIESSFEIMYENNYQDTDREIHAWLLNTILEEIKSRRVR